MGIGFILYSMGETTFQCDRSQDRCILEDTTVIGGDTAEISVQDLQGAIVVQTAGNRPGYDTTPKYRAFVEAEQGQASLSHESTANESYHQTLADEVNAFIDDPGQQRLETFDDGGQIVQKRSKKSGARLGEMICLASKRSKVALPGG